MNDPRSSQVRVQAGNSSRRLASADPPAGMLPDDDELTVISTRGPFTEEEDGPLLRPLEVGKMLEGERLGQFVLQKYVGGGGMGVVFKALDTTLNREVAVKVLARSQSQDEETLRRFQNEAQSAARLDHDNIARVYYVGEDRGVHYIVFEFIEGVNIRDLVQQNGPLPLADAISYTLQVAEALAHASQRDVIHRDIKPSNVLITPDGKAKLVDMGLARLHQVEHADHDLTASGVTLGTFDYISPEQARDPRSADVRSDLYSLGCSCYFMLTGRPPFPEGTVLQKLLQHQGDDPPDPRNFRPGLPAELTTILARLLAKSPTRRYQQPSELIAELSAVGERVGVPSTGFTINYRPNSRLASPPAWQRHLPWLVPLTILIVIVLALDYIWSRDSMMPGINPPAVESQAQRNRAPDHPANQNEPTQSPAAAEQAPTAASVTSPDLPPERSAIGVAAQLANGIALLAEVPNRLWRAAPTFRPRAESVNDSDGEPTSAPATGSSAESTGLESHEKLADRSRVLTVASDRRGTQVYPSLAAAVGSATPGAVIELDWDGSVEERPLTLTDTSIQIRAAAGRRPRVVFRPSTADAIGYPRAMLTIAGGTLTLAGVDIELEMPRKISADSWSLFELRHAESLTLNRVVLTIRNASPTGGSFHPAVACFDVKSPPGSDTMAMRTMSPTGMASRIELTDCVVRGGAALVRSDDSESARLQAANVLMGMSEPLLLARGSSSDGRGIANTEFDLRQVTAIARAGLARLANDEDAPQLPKSVFNLEGCRLVGGELVPWIEQRGTATVEQFRDSLGWSARQVAFSGPAVMWRIESVTAAQQSQLSYAEWESYWGTSRESECELSPLSRPAEALLAKPPHEITPADLATITSNAGAGTTASAGCDPARLPSITSD